MVDWTPELEGATSSMWLDGESARTIATHIQTVYGVTVSRNAVIGKVHRMGLMQPKPPKQIPVPMSGANFRSTCQWPLWGNEPPTHEYCGEKAETDQPYCRKHCAKAYRTAPDNEEDLQVA